MELTAALEETINLLKGRVSVVLDALDECPPAHMQGERQLLLDWNDLLLQRNNSNLHILGTSRPEPDIRKRLLNKRYTINIENPISADLGRHHEFRTSNLG